ncbi:formimidoylglutamate deiminase [Acuticoccus sediminis]|uniref:Formimidoylglutamate deiminase n=1 Tax=Acuticoccus sediminis TaxID=2184697 RepID=A0A8B2P1F4_9HYPH|nr:formimidoylglutamate deiminase [Acuticoccus sediminis]RAI02107.1 formimidoylglutamate deiminase [Acuticoccus sediminis]
MTVIHAAHALLPSGLERDVRITVSGETVEDIRTGAAAEAGDERHGMVIPAMGNVHSHAFQRAMAGLTELRGPTADNFWSWRREMYRIGLNMDPGHVEAVAAQLYMEMLEAGFARVGEFHYLHHDRDGSPYADPAEMAERIAAASDTAGIGLTLLPVFYAHADFGGLPPLPGQRRFIHGLDDFARLVERCGDIAAALPGGIVGVAPHSLRAVTADELAAVAALTDGPIHIHAAEQVGEVEGCVAATGARPVEWLLANTSADERWCFIHATHMTGDEVGAMAERGVVAGLCPITESNLGDGIFPAVPFLEGGGRFGVGSDSNVDISLKRELRTLEYSQRLAHRARNVLAPAGGSTGQHLFEEALRGGAAAIGSSAGLAPGERADIVALDLDAVPWLPADKALDHFVFTDGITVDAVWSGGRKVVAEGRHIHRAAITARFHAAMHELMAAEPS